MDYSNSIRTLSANRRFVAMCYREISTAIWSGKSLTVDEVDMWSRGVRVALDNEFYEEADALTRLLEDTRKDAGKCADRRREAAIKARAAFHQPFAELFGKVV
jgi:hypothetical protein